MLSSGFGDQGFEFLWEPEFAAADADDEHWAQTFHRFGGEIVVSADKNIAKRLHQILAFQANDLICYFCDHIWSNQDMTMKAAHLVTWWPRIQAHLGKAKPRDCFWIPMSMRATPFRPINLPPDVEAKIKKRKV